MSHLRNRNLSLAVCAVGGMVWASALWHGPASGASEAFKTVFALAASSTVFGLVSALMFAVPAAGEARVRSRRDVIARWHVDATRWAAFAAYDRTLAAKPSMPSQRLGVTRRELAEGAEIVVGKSGLLVGNRYAMLENGFMVAAGLRMGPPLCVEFQFEVVGGDGPSTAYRLTVPTEHDDDSRAADVVAVHDEFLRVARDRAARVPRGFLFRDARRWRAIFCWVLACCVLSAAWAGAALAQRDAGPFHGLLLGGGIIVGLGAAVLVLVTHGAAKRGGA